MTRPVRCACLLASLTLLGLAQAQGPSGADRAAAAVFQRVSGLPRAVALRRIAAGDQSDLVVALASGQSCEAAPHPCWWTTRDRLGILLQDRNDPDIVQPLVMEPGPNDDNCSARIERFTTQELVLACAGEKWSTYDNQKFVYDLHARKLVSHVSYPPFFAAHVLYSRSGPQFVMADNHRLLLVEIDPTTGAPRVVSAEAARPVLAQIHMMENTFGDPRNLQTLHVPEPAPDPVNAFGPGGRFHLAKQKNKYGSEYPVIVEGEGSGRKVYSLAQTDRDTWRRDRPDDARTPMQLDPEEMNEQIGPHQLEEGRLWFGKTFYNGEGLTGVGGFGYFDTATAQYHLLAPPEIHAWSVSAILVEPGDIFLALDRRGEYGNYPGGLLRWDRKTAQVQHWDLSSVAVQIARWGDAIYLGTADGIVSVRGDRLESWFVDRSTGGRYQMEAHR